PEAQRSPQEWATMVATVKGSQSAPFLTGLCTWVETAWAAPQTHAGEPLRLTRVAALWRHRPSYWLRLIALVGLLGVLLTPLQYLVGELLLPWDAAGFVGGTSFVAPGRYIPVEATTEPGDTRVLRTGMSTYGWIRLRLLDKPHTGRSLRITSHG